MLRPISIIATLIYVAALPLGAVDVPIANAGFEQFVLPCAPGPNCFSGFSVFNVPGWTATGQVATFKPSSGAGGIYPGGIPEGVNVVALGNELDGVSFRHLQRSSQTLPIPSYSVSAPGPIILLPDTTSNCSPVPRP